MRRRLATEHLEQSLLPVAFESGQAKHLAEAQLEIERLGGRRKAKVGNPHHGRRGGTDAHSVSRSGTRYPSKRGASTSCLSSVAIRRPDLSTVTASESASTSSRRCEM